MFALIKMAYRHHNPNEFLHKPSIKSLPFRRRCLGIFAVDRTKVELLEKFITAYVAVYARVKHQITLEKKRKLKRKILRLLIMHMVV